MGISSFQSSFSQTCQLPNNIRYEQLKLSITKDGRLIIQEKDLQPIIFGA